MSLIPGRPLVVIAGWLGCQPRSLRRYEELYRNLGFGALSCIATPRMVVKASTQGPQQQIYSTVELSCVNEQNLKPETMQDLAWNVLHDVHSSQCSVAMFHVFSNGGGFLWEQIRTILTDNDNDEHLKAIRFKIVGVVFDSAPARYSPASGRNTLFDALQHCPWRERMSAYAQVAKQIATLSLDEREQRATNYFESMRNDPCHVRQLYLFSRDDLLTPHRPLEELVQHRQKMFGNNRIQRWEWASSPHCCHLLRHPVEYHAAVAAFVETCLYDDAKLQSKL